MKELEVNMIEPIPGSVQYWQREAERAIVELAAVRASLGGKLGVLKEALYRAHACATRRDDGTCDGCFVSEALVEVSK